MVLPANMAKAVYNDPGIEQYRGNPLIEALPPIMTTQQIKQGLDWPHESPDSWYHLS